MYYFISYLCAHDSRYGTKTGSDAEPDGSARPDDGCQPVQHSPTHATNGTGWPGAPDADASRRNAASAPGTVGGGIL